MNAFELLVRYQRLVFAFALLAVLTGLVSYGTMARQEDPSFPYRVGTLQITYPGATARQIEKLITEPLEEELAQVEELEKISSVSRDNVAIVTLNLADTIYDTDAAWDRVRRAMDRAEGEFPDGVSDIVLEDRRMEIPTVILSVTGSDDPVFLADAAEELKRMLLGVAGVSRIEIVGAPEKELVVEIDSGELNRLGINRQHLMTALQQRNQLIPGGLINAGEQFIRLNTASDLQSLRDIQQLPIELDNGQRVPLSAIASVAMQPREPLAAQTYHDGHRAVSLGIIAVRGQTDTIAFGERLRARVAELAPAFQPLQIRETFFQPDFVQQRLDGLSLSLLISAGVIALVVLLALGWRNGLLVAMVLPVVALVTLAVYNLGGGILHQIAVIGVVISLGILVDNAIVIVESIDKKLRLGLSRAQAVKDSVSQLALPLFSSTGTTIAAFIPLLLSKGGTADFTRGIPVMITLALITSYLISVIVLPMVAFYWLKPAARRSTMISDRIAARAIAIQRRSRWLPLLLIAALLVLVSASATQLKLQFFPGADRNQMVIDLELPAGTPVEHTARLSGWLETELKQRDDVAAVMRTVGATGFRFYYNLSTKPSDPSRARLMVTTRSFDDNRAIIDWIDTEVQRKMPEAVLVARGMGQGPPLAAPIELHLQHPDQTVLFAATQIALKALHQSAGTRNIRSNLDQGIPEIHLRLIDDTLVDMKLNRNTVASELFAQTRGLDSGQFRYSNDPVTMRVRSSAGSDTGLDRVPSFYVYREQQPIPLETLATLKTRWAAAEIHHHNFLPTVTLLSELQPGAAYNQVLQAFYQQLQQSPLPDGVDLIIGGESEGSADANKAIVATAPIGVMALLFFMLIQFNSFRRIGIILTTIPLAALGIVPGLLLSDSAFGFQPLLGVIALIGIVVNNAIVLIDVVDQNLAEGKTIDEAVYDAIRQRTAPILLTTATTILGLLPLALSQSTLWPPMAWAIISGLAMSTLLTLVVIPSLCRLLLGQRPADTRVASAPAVSR
ncbi:MAG: efflux RND transporter permease subunit [Candidatus Pelagadaptatus aseana]|uniref:efflux RND transporter permease subunit n=1 Tax=Candidatus Pelagadaptatus aseana TaxID=3120508 RepID=UPI0039B2FA6A